MSVNKELLEAVRECENILEELPVHTHGKAVEVLINLGNHRLQCAQEKQRADQAQAEINAAFGLDRPRIVTQ